jgi:hypothetical protein
MEHLTYPQGETTTKLYRSICDFHKANALFNFWLGHFDSKKLFLEEGFSSLFHFMTDGQGFCEGDAMKRIKVSRYCHQKPDLHRSVALGDYNFSTLALIAETTVSDATKQQALQDLKRKTKRFAETYFAKLVKPVTTPKYREKITPIGTIKPNLPLSPGNDHLPAKFPVSPQRDPVATTTEATDSTLSTAAHPTDLSTGLDPTTPSESTPNAQHPTSEILYKITLELKESDLDQIRRIGELTGTHTVADSIQTAVKFYLAKRDPIKDLNAGSLHKNSTTIASHIFATPDPSTPRSRYIPSEIRKAVWKVYKGQCGYRAPDTGQRCQTRHHLEIEHIKPYAKGGEHTLDNLMLLCRGHNQLMAKRHFGTLQIVKDVPSIEYQ